MGIATVAVYSEADRDAAHVGYADEAYLLGPAAAGAKLPERREAARGRRPLAAPTPSIPATVSSPRTRASRAPSLDAGLTWVGPHPAAIDAMGDKLRARAGDGRGRRAGRSRRDRSARRPSTRRARAAREYGLPLALKASGGGGGKGLKVARSDRRDRVGVHERAARSGSVLQATRRSTPSATSTIPSTSSCKSSPTSTATSCTSANATARCSAATKSSTRRRPPRSATALRRRLREAGIRAARAIGYDSVGTIETLVAGDEFFFLEMNTRIQVEHTISEMISGLDLVREQMRVAAGEPLGYGQRRDRLARPRDRGARQRRGPGRTTSARRPARSTALSRTGRTRRARRLRGVARVRRHRSDYDSMIAKLIVWAPTRDQALARLRRAIDEYAIAGVPTTLPFLRALNDEPRPSPTAATARRRSKRSRGPTLQPPSRRRIRDRAGRSADGAADDVVRVEVNDRLFRVRAAATGRRPARGPRGARAPPPRRGESERGNGRARARDDVARADARRRRRDPRRPGETVPEGEVVAVIEAMKMMNEIRAQRAGTIARVQVEARHDRRGAARRCVEFERASTGRESRCTRDNASGIPLKPSYDRADGERALAAEGPSEPGDFPYLRGIRADGYRGALDDAPVRRFRDRRRVERALPLSARARHHRTLGRLRSADATRLRLRRAAGARRGRQGRRRDRHDRATWRRCFDGIPLDERHRLDDDQRAGLDPARDGPRGRAPARHPVRAARRHGPERRAQRVRRARDLHLPAAARRCGSSPT